MESVRSRVSNVEATRESRHILPVMVAAAVANALAYVRDATVASTFGASAETDAYFVGTFVPTLIATILVQGSLVPAFLPTFARYAADKVASARIASAAITAAAAILAAAAAAILFTAEPVVHLIAPGWTDTQLATAATLLRISMPSVVALGLSTILAAVSNAHHHYLAPPLGFAVSNATAALTTFALGHRIGITAPALGMLLGSVFQVLIQFLAVARLGTRLRPAFDAPEEALRGIGFALIPMAAYSALSNSVPLLERWLASGLPAGQLSLVSYAAKLVLVPITVITTSSAAVFFVGMSHDSVSNDWQSVRETLGRGVRLVSFLLTLATVVLVWLSGPLVDVALRRGGFTTDDAAITARLVSIYALGIVPNGLALLLTRSYQARNAHSPVFIAVLANLPIYAVAAAVLSRYWGVFGLVAAFPVTQLAGALLLYGLQPRVLRLVYPRDFRHGVALLVVGSFASGAVLAGTHLLAGAAGMTGPSGSLMLISAGTVLATGASLAGARMLRIREADVLAEWLKQVVVAPASRLRPSGTYHL